MIFASCETPGRRRVSGETLPCKRKWRCGVALGAGILGLGLLAAEARAEQPAPPPADTAAGQPANPWHMPGAKPGPIPVEEPVTPDGSPRASTGWGSPSPPAGSPASAGLQATPGGGYGAPQGYYSPPAYYPPYQPYAHPPTVAPDRVDQDDAEDDGTNDPPYFDLAVGTYVPLSIGAQASLELPARLLVQGDIGWMPGMYGSAINGLIQQFGGYDGNVGELVDGALDGAVVLRLSGGWRPFPNAGFEILGGYTFVSVSGSASPEEIASVVGGGFDQTLEAAGVTDDVSLSSQLHNFHVALGWRWVAFEHLVIRANVGYLQTLGSSAELSVPSNPELADQANPAVDETLNELYTSYVKLPVLGLSGGYRF